MIKKINYCGCNINLDNYTTVYDENLTLLELIIGTIYKLNETIDITNSNYKDIQEMLNNLTDINSEITNIKTELSTLKDDITKSVQAQINELNTKVIQLMNDYQKIFTGQLDTLRADLEKQIQEIIIGNIYVYNPTNGLTENINKVIIDIYDNSRTNSITAQEFDNLELTATEFDEKEITAFNFDNNAKVLLTA